MLALGLQRHDGPVALLGAGCWTRRDRRVLVSCPDCGGVDVVVGIDANGSTLEPFFCQTASCSFRRWLRLEGFAS